MKAGDLVKSRGDSSLALVLEIVLHARAKDSAVHILLNDGRRIWVGASMLEPVNATG